VISHGAELVRAFAAAGSPRVTVILRKAFGGAFITMNSKALGADASFCWPNAEIGVMSPGAAVEIIHRRLLLAAGIGVRDELTRRYAQHSVSPEAALGSGAIDAVIDPTETREHVARALRLDRATARGDSRITRGPAEDDE
jgi:acetyl-CoA carboxylase carboxyltransferase component